MLKLAKSRCEPLRRVRMLDRWVREVLACNLLEKGGRLCLLVSSTSRTLVSHTEIQTWTKQLGLQQVDVICWKPFGYAAHDDTVGCLVRIL